MARRRPSRTKGVAPATRQGKRPSDQRRGKGNPPSAENQGGTSPLARALADLETALDDASCAGREARESLDEAAAAERRNRVLRHHK